MRAGDDEAGPAQLGSPGRADQESDVPARICQARAEIAAGRAGTDDEDPHGNYSCSGQPRPPPRLPEGGAGHTTDDMFDLPKTSANYAPLSPLSFIRRTADVFPDRVAIVHGALRQSWADTYIRCRRLASALSKHVAPGQVVAAMLPNTPAMVEAHFGVPMAGAVLNALNVRLDAETIAYILEHGEARVVLVDREFAGVIRRALDLLPETARPYVVDVEDALAPPGERAGSETYEAFLERGDPAFEWSLPADEWDAIALNYTSGTTGKPKGVVYHHRGAYMNAVGNVLTWALPHHPVYLWTLPMFHCNGWCFPWTVAAMAGTNVCLRRVEATAIRNGRSVVASPFASRRASLVVT